MWESQFPKEWEQTGALWTSESSSDLSLLTRLVFAAVFSSSRWRRILCLLIPVEGFSSLLGMCCWKVLELQARRKPLMAGQSSETPRTLENWLGSQGHRRLCGMGACEVCHQESLCSLIVNSKEVQNVTMVSSVPTQRNNVAVLETESRRLSGSTLRLFSLLFTFWWSHQTT